ncbi:MAG: hypothetical protein WDW36_008987 [Sanguina aurantia]
MLCVSSAASSVHQLAQAPGGDRSCLSEGQGRQGCKLHVCLDCGFIYSDTKTAFEDLPGSYACPACSAPKRRFKVLEGSTGKSNNDKSMAERRDKLRDQIEAAGGNPDEGDQEPLLLFGGAAIAFFAAVTYFVTNR